MRLLRDRIDVIASNNPAFAFISFADSLLVKQVWSVGHVDSEISYTYSPESLFPAVIQLREAILETLGLSSYAIMSQGINAYADNEASYQSTVGNHFSFNTLGLPFAQILATEEAARSAIRSDVHAPAELYIDTMFYRSLNFKVEFDKNQLELYPYRSPMTKSATSMYVAMNVSEILENLK